MLKNDEYNQAPEVGQSSAEGVGGLKLKSNLGNKELEGMKPCPHCERMIAEEDRICMHCGFDLKRGRTIQEMNKKFPISPKVLVSIIVVVALIVGGYLYRQQVSEFIDDKAGTNLTEQVEKYAPVAATTEKGIEVEDAEDKVDQEPNSTAQGVDDVDASESASEEVKVNPFSSLDLEELTYKKEDLAGEVADLKEDLKYTKVDYKAMSQELARAKKGYQISASKAGKYKVAYQDSSKSRTKRLDYKEQYIQYIEEAKGYKQEYSELSKQAKELLAQAKEPKENLAKKTLELQQVNEAIKAKQ